MKCAHLFTAAALAALASCSDNGDRAAKPSDATADETPTEQTDPGSPPTDDGAGQDRDDRQFDPDMAYYFSQGDRGPALSFGVPQTDNIALNLRCPPGAMGKTVLVSFNRPAEIVAQRPDMITLAASGASQRLAIDTRETQLGTTVEVAADPNSAVMQAYRRGATLSVSYGDETIAIPSRSSDGEIEEFFGACRA